jgi:secreted trypsin-like serine protease
MRRTLVVTALTLLIAAVPAGAAIQRDVRIVGGGLAAPGQFPFAVALVEHRVADASRGQFCGGSIIAPDAILTAAHCIVDTRASEVDVVSGRLRLSDTPAGERVRVTKIVPHPDYDTRTLHNDFAVLRLAKPLETPPVTLADDGDAPLTNQGTLVASAGWGLVKNDGPSSDDLRWVRLSVRLTGDCRRPYPDYDRRLQVCAASRNGDTCSGDSGGPLVAGDGADAKLLGVVSFGGVRCLDQKKPGVYARVSAVREWVLQQAGTLPPAPAGRPHRGAHRERRLRRERVLRRRAADRPAAGPPRRQRHPPQDPHAQGGRPHPLRQGALAGPVARPDRPAVRPPRDRRGAGRQGLRAARRGRRDRGLGHAALAAASAAVRRGRYSRLG